MDTYTKSLLTEPPRVLGVQLRPLSLWHSVLLQEVESPYWTNESEYEMLDLPLAVYICSQEWDTETNGNCLDDSNITKLAKWWGKKCRKVARDVDLWRSHEAAFEAYIADYTTFPKRWSVSGSEPKVPYAFGVMTLLMHGLGLSESRAWNMPLSMAMCHVASFSAYHGDKDLMSPSEEEGISVLKQAQQESN